MLELLNKPINEIDFAIVDVETTGFSGDSKIIEIAAVKIRNGKITESFNSLVYADYVPSFVTKVHGIDSGMLKDAPQTFEIKTEFFDFINSCVLVGHNFTFDKRFLYKQFDLPNTPHVDTLSLSRVIYTEKRKHDLDTLAKRFHIRNKQRHRALSDAKTNAKVFLNLLALGKTRFKILNDIIFDKSGLYKEGNAKSNKNVSRINDKKATRKKKLGDLGELIATTLLKKAGFTDIRNLNLEYQNTPYADILAKRKGKDYVISIKARNKYEVSGVLNSRYKFEDDCYNHAAKISKQYNAEPAWVSIALDIKKDVFDAYFGLLALLNGNKGIPMTPKATEAYECLACNEPLISVGIKKEEYQKLKNARNRL